MYIETYLFVIYQWLWVGLTHVYIDALPQLYGVRLILRIAL